MFHKFAPAVSLNQVDMKWYTA